MAEKVPDELTEANTLRGGPRRVRLEMTVHPLTDERMERLCGQFATSKGRLIDKLIECLHVAYSTRKQHCITGRPCKIELTDLPDVY